MRINRIFGVKSVTHLIYGILLLIPFFSVLSRCVYVAVNKNAVQSYSSSYVKNLSSVTNNDFLITGNTYTINDVVLSSSGTISTPLFTYSEINIDWSNLYGAPTNYSYNGFRLVTNITNGNKFVYLYENGSQVWEIHDGSISFLTMSMPLTFKLVDSTLYSTTWYSFFNTSLVTFGLDSLDNVFDYSLSTFLDENDNYSIDFFSWFTDLFLKQETQHNALYLNFCNWYMNYILLVSSGYLLFFALLWFINYVRKILERSSYHDFGGF